MYINIISFRNLIVRKGENAINKHNKHQKYSETCNVQINVLQISEKSSNITKIRKK